VSGPAGRAFRTAADPVGEDGSAAAVKAEARDAIVRRSILIVPADKEKFLEGAWKRDADAILLDLEDGVSPGGKGAAREIAAGYIERRHALAGPDPAVDLIARVNSDLESLVRDVEAVVRPGLTCLWAPKVESAEQVAVLDHLIAAREIALGMRPWSVQLGIAIESSRGLFAAPEIAAVARRPGTMQFSSEDVLRELGIEATEHGDERFFGTVTVVAAAAVGGLQPLGTLGRLAGLSDMAAWRAGLRRARELGTRGSTCIHPTQVAAANEEFAVPAEARDAARAVVEGFEAARGPGSGAIDVRGRMVDAPVYDRALRVLARAEAIDDKERRKAAWKEEMRNRAG
jgi:citrate lyase subunit beta/citryl-CoA lyase